MLASVAFVVTPAAAQTQDSAPAADQPSSAKGDSGLVEIVVTAEKRSVNLQDVALPISAYTSDVRQIAGIDTLQDFANFTPGLSYSASNDRVFIRGIGRQTNTNGSDPGVSTYTDGIYDSSTASIAASDFLSNALKCCAARKARFTDAIQLAAPSMRSPGDRRKN
ncbi:hypothetical protein C8024_08890 [Sphingopyxis sp. BSNA05]|nr:hypothetical protein [Sphingopyxis sp. BSNA05]